MKHFVLMACAIFLSWGVFATQGQAARITDVLDAADSNGDSFDFSFAVDFTQVLEQAKISRERNTTSRLDKRMLMQREFEYKAVKNYLDIELKFGLYRDLEFHINLPITIRETNNGKQTQHYRDKYWAGDYNPATLTSGGRPSLLHDQVFGYSKWESIHKGVGDMTLGFSYSPVNQERVKEYPTWVFSIDIQVPTGPEQKPQLEKDATNQYKGKSNTTGVGKKLVGLTFSTAISRRWNVVEPYFGMHYKFTFDTGKLIKNSRYEGGFVLGMEVIPYEFKAEKENEPRWKVALDFRLQATIMGKGQDFNAIVDPLAWRKDKNGTQYWPVDTRTVPYYVYPNGQAPAYELPIEDRYTYVQGYFGIYAVLYHYLTLRTEFGFGHRTEHFLSLPNKVDASTLRPVNKNGYNTQINEVGARVKLTNSFVFSYMFSLGINY